MRKQKSFVRKSFMLLLIFLILFSPYGQAGLTQASERDFDEELDISVEGSPSREQVVLKVETSYSDLMNLELLLPKGVQYDAKSTKDLNSTSQVTYDDDENSLNIPKEDTSSISEKIVLTGFDIGENILQVRGHLEEGMTDRVEYIVYVEEESSDSLNDEIVEEDSNFDEVDESKPEQSESDGSSKDESSEEQNAESDTPESEKSDEASEGTEDESSPPNSEIESQQQEESNQHEESNENEDELIFTPMVGDLNVDIDISPLNTNVLAGNDAAYKLVFKTTGAITEYTNATITVDLPLSNEVGFNQSLSELRIAGVEPTFDAENNQLVYQFDTLQAGQTYENIIKLTTTNGLIANGSELEVQASFEADQFDEVQDTATVVVDASTTISASKRYTEARGNDRNIPIPNAQTVWVMNVDIPKNSTGQNYLEPGSQITVVDTLPNGLSYHSMVDGPEPEQSGNVLTWTFEAPSIEDQEAAEDTLFNTELEIVLTVGSNTVDQTLTNNIDVTAQFIGDDNENSVNANHSVTIADSDRATGEIRGSVYVPSHLGPINDRGNVGSNTNRDPNPLVYDDALLAFYHNISPLHESSEGDFQSYTTVMNIDENLVFKEMRTGGTAARFIYRPTADFPPGVPFLDPPRFNIEADIDGQSRVVLIENAEIGRIYTRNDLGIEANARVNAIYLNFTHAPSGMGGAHPTYYFEVEPGYVGNVTNEFDVYGTGANGTVFGNSTNGRKYGSPDFFNNIGGPRSAQIAPRPTDQPPIATVDVELTNHQGSYVDFGDNRMRVNLNTENSSTLAMSEPLEAMVLLPPGVTISDDPDAGFTDADGRASDGSFEIVSDNYNDTGRQLVKFNWTDRLLRPGKNVASEINVQINEGAANVLTFDVYGFSGDESLTVPSVDNPGQTDTVLQTDSEDLNENGNTDQPRLKSGNEYYMSGQYNIQTEKLVRGELDDAFTTFGRTVPGGAIDYQLTLTNTTGSTISTMTLMDVLPSIGDLGITDNIDRGSQFTPQLTEAIQLPSQWEDRVDVYYSTALTPERDDLTRNTNYPDTTEQLSNPEGAQAPNWVLASEVEDWSSIHSFKIELSDGVEWIDGEDIAIAFSMMAPEAADVDQSVLDKTINPTQRAAWNSFAIATDQGQPVEPARVGVYMDLDNSVQLTKQSEDGELLEGAVFTLFNEVGEEVATGLTTDENGILFIEDLLPGNYELVETQAPTGYVLDATPIPFTIDLAVQELIELTKENSPVPGSVELSKVGEDGETLEGAVFSLFDSDDNELQTGLTTNEEGLLVVEDLAPGSYYFVETEAPFGYVLDDTPLPFDIVFNQEVQVGVTKENTLIPGAVELTKEDEDGTILEGVEFELQDRDGNTVREGLLTDDEGKLFIDDLTPGRYQLVETATLPGYELDPTPIPFEIGLGQTTVTEVSFVNEFTPGSVGLTKVGESGDTLEGAVFSLFDSEDNELQTGLTTNEEGRLVVEELAPGSYYFVETEAPFGYELDDTPLAFDIDFNQEAQLELTRENLLIPGAVELTKVDEEGTVLEGVEFELQDADGNVLREGLLTDEEGTLFIDDLTPGSYQLVETATLPGYELNPTPIPFEIGLGETTVGELSFMNEFTPGSVSLTKVGQDEAVLEGAVFSLFDAEDNELQTGLTTNEDGQIVVEDLAPGTYYFVETEAPFGYELDATPLEFEIIFNQESQLELTKENTVIPGAVELTKEDEGGAVLEGVEFALQDREGNVLQEGLLTDEDGTLFIDGLVPGNYQLVETAAIPGYVLDPTPIPFEITLGQTETVELSFVNEFSPGSVGLTKVGESGETLEGAVFSLFDAEDNELQTGLTTDEDGRIVVENLEPGNYYFVETEAPFGYELDDTPLEFEIVFNQEAQLELTKENTLIPGAIELTKEDTDGTVLEGVEFELQDSEGNTLREGLLTNEEGKLLIDDLAPGNYQLIETATLPGYELDPTPIVFEIGLGETTVGEFSFVNEFTPGSVGLTKVDQEGETLEGAVFSLFDAEDNELETGLTINEEGRLVVEELAPGAYYFVETEAPFGYELDSTPLEFEIVFNQEAQLEVTKENVLILGSVALAKENENETGLEGVEFELQDTEGNTLREGLLTDENGVLLLDDLEPGSYQFVETATIPGYVLDPTPISFEIELGPTDIIELNFINEFTLGSVGLTKVDEEGETLEGAIFSLFDAEDNELQTGLTTDEEGRLVVEELAPGTYYFVETEAPFGYELDSTPLKFEIVFNQEAQLELTKENTLIPGAIELTKEDEDGTVIEGVEFELQDSEGNMLREGLLTNEEGKLLIDDLEPGSYQLVETATLPGYELDPTPISFEIGLGQTTITEVSFINEFTLGSVALTKVDEEGDTLEGAVFTLYDAEDNELQTGLTTDEEGRLVVEELAIGNYYFEETEAPVGYELDNTPLEFEIVFNQETQLEVIKENSAIPGAVELTKVDEEGENLEGAVFTLYDSEDNELQTGLTTNEEGKLVVNDLAPGSYYFVETEAPFGYQIDETPRLFEVEFNQQEVVMIEVVNELILGHVTIIKVDSETDVTLQGAEFEIRDGQDQVVETVTTNDLGLVDVQDLTPGDYQLIETKAPEGYQQLVEAIAFTVQVGMEETLELFVQNTKLPPGESTPPPPTETPDPPTTPEPPEPSDTPPTSGSSEDVPKTLPQTGEEWFRYLLIAGSLLIIVGSLLIVFNRRKVTMA
ncbi:SpaA isopeptide-forming pilin-related protein [Alkalicoccobacillus porphyridii]|uniref:LPXTG cell wall anchor domain-containing protein n=1 Tax=Alkalicoccobacillus porphyridii TaxID=2597270 RepID=A0A554A4F9_9BACI|nr:SpaA isopeptide-forming pilin-related protein [Alkalicoccobacillus porphyridii]TSB48561.1 LPXTG cell wall anchor domain-containing protein [Alkalicoccobacillus porphyridii]